MEQFNKHLRKTKKGKKTLYKLLQSFIVGFICLLKIKSESKPTSVLTIKLKSGSLSQTADNAIGLIVGIGNHFGDGK